MSSEQLRGGLRNVRGRKRFVLLVGAMWLFDVAFPLRRYCALQPAPPIAQEGWHTLG